MKKIEDLWQLLKDVELVQVRPIEMEAMYKHCFEFERPGIVEIGSAHGASSIILAEAARELNGSLICIDHFPEDYYGQEKFGNYGRKAFKKNIKPYQDVVYHINLSSEAAKHQVFNILHELRKDLCILFIDGNHDYEAVKRDIQNYVPLVRSGGYIGFHDYYNVSFGVQKAVDENREGLEGPTQYWDLAVFKKL